MIQKLNLRIWGLSWSSNPWGSKKWHTISSHFFQKSSGESESVSISDDPFKYESDIYPMRILCEDWGSTVPHNLGFLRHGYHWTDE